MHQSWHLGGGTMQILRMSQCLLLPCKECTGASSIGHLKPYPGVHRHQWAGSTCLHGQPLYPVMDMFIRSHLKRPSEIVRKHKVLRYLRQLA